MPKIHINDVDLYYQSAGAGEPVFFLHGLGGCSSDWDLQIPDVAKSHRTIAMDVRGHGRSSQPPGPYSVRQFADDAIALLRSLQMEPAHVVGLSMGGMIAFEMAVDSPQSVRSLTILNSGPEMILRTLQEQQIIEARYKIVREMGMLVMAKMIAEPLFPKTEQIEVRQRFEHEIASNDPRAYLDSLSAINGWSVMDRIGNIQCPVLIVASDQDYTPLEWKRAYAAKISGARVAVLGDSRHAGNLDQPEKFNRVLLEFLGQCYGKLGPVPG
jgi:pimeloyl-ACP methyl ester carboxylesterase